MNCFRKPFRINVKRGRRIVGQYAKSSQKNAIRLKMLFVLMDICYDASNEVHHIQIIIRDDIYIIVILLI